MELERRGVQDLAFTIATAESFVKFKRESSKAQGKKIGGSGKGGEIGTSPPRWTNLPKTSGRARRIRHQRNTHATYAMGLTESLYALNTTNFLPLSKRKRSKRRRGGPPHSSYSMSFKQGRGPTSWAYVH